MKPRTTLLALAIASAALIPSACKREAAPAAAPAARAPVASEGETADQFVARVNREYRAIAAETNAAQWLSNTDINSDTELLAAKANERWLTRLNGWIVQSRRFEGRPMSPETARALKLLKLMSAMPAPRDPKQLEELTRIATRMEGTYGAGKYCTGQGYAASCLDFGQL